MKQHDILIYTIKTHSTQAPKHILSMFEPILLHRALFDSLKFYQRPAGGSVMSHVASANKAKKKSAEF